uniref:AP2 domain transcription factor AP2X-10 n=1 Tax=Neospora caninum (strain Liverpool) TaxID=572307 RepID=A0A0F7UHQ7_NEOCL|nr:TPA: AP2 domain transcription factor AP2X-10 [Neospora caninum Liverpool]
MTRVFFRLGVKDANASFVHIDLIALSLHFVLAALDGLRDAWREGSRNTKARAQILESILAPLCLQQRCRGSYPFRIPQHQVMQHQALLGLQLLGFLPGPCPSPSSLSSLASCGALLKPNFSGTTSATPADAAGAATLPAAAAPRGGAYGGGMPPVSSSWFVPPSSHPVALTGEAVHNCGAGSEGIGYRDVASLAHHSARGGTSECCCCCGYGHDRAGPARAGAKPSFSDDSRIFPDRTGHSQHRPGGRHQPSPGDLRCSTSEKAASARVPLQAGNSGRAGNAGMKAGAGGYVATGEVVGGGGQTGPNGGAKQRRGRYRTAAVVAAEEGDDADIYKKPRPAVTSRRVLLQRQQQQHAATGTTGGVGQASTNGACDVPEVNSLTPCLHSDMNEQSTAAPCNQHLGELENGETDDTLAEQDPEATSVSDAVISTPSAGAEHSACGIEGGDSGEQQPQKDLPPRNAIPAAGQRSAGCNDTSGAVDTAATGRTAATNLEHSPTQTPPPQLQQSGAAAVPAAGSAPHSGKHASVGAGATMTMRTTRHNKTKQPGVFQFTRGIKRFWAASWYADGHPGWKAFSVEKWGNTEALKRARKAYEEKVPHGAAMLNTYNLGTDETATGDGDTSVTSPSGGGAVNGSEDIRRGTLAVSDSSQQKQRPNIGKESQRQQDRGVLLHQASNAPRANNGRKKQQQSQSGAAAVESASDQRGSDLTFHGRSTGASFGSSSSIFSGDTEKHTNRFPAATQTQQQLQGDDFLQAFWDEFDSNDSQAVGTGGILSLGGSSGRCSASSCYDSSSSSGFYLRSSLSYSPRPGSGESSDGHQGSAMDGHKQKIHNFFGEPGTDQGALLGRDHSSRHEFEEDDLALLSPTQFLLGSENDDITGKLLLSGPDMDTPTLPQ